MANYPRYLIIGDGSIFHVTWQCHNKDWLLKEEWAKEIYYNLLLKYKDKYRLQIYSYCFMSNHPHITGKCQSKELFSDFFRVVNSCFAKAYNKKMGRRGQVVMDRFKSPRIESEEHLLRVMFYIDLNPVRAGITDDPSDYKWSSYRYYAFGKKDALLTVPHTYRQLGINSKARQLKYKRMVQKVLRNDWRLKRPYNSIPFIGNPLWVQERYDQLKSERKNQYINLIDDRPPQFGASP